MASAFRFDISGVMNGLNQYSNRMSAGLDLYGRVAADKMASYARDNKTWTDRTSHAKQSIQGHSFRQGNNLIIAVSGGMDYSPYLEFAMDKRYAIIYPTLQQHKSEILSGLRNIVR